MTKNYYSTIEVGKILHLSRVAVLKRVKSGKIKGERVGKNYIISHESLLEALGKSLGREKRESIEKAVSKAIAEYEEVFKKLGKE